MKDGCLESIGWSINKWKFAGKYEVKRTMDKVQNSARSARMMNDEGRLALVETICAQRSELFIRKSPATAKPSAETGHSSIVLPYNFPFAALLEQPLLFRQ